MRDKTALYLSEWDTELSDIRELKPGFQQKRLTLPLEYVAVSPTTGTITYQFHVFYSLFWIVRGGEPNPNGLNHAATLPSTFSVNSHTHRRLAVFLWALLAQVEA